MNLHDERHTADGCDGRYIADEVKVELEHPSVDGICCRDQEQRVTVRGCPHDRLGSNAAAGAGVVLDDNRLPKSLRQPLPDQSRDDIGRATGAKAFDQVHRPRGKALRASEL